MPGPPPENEENEAPAELVKTLPFDTKASPALDLTALLAGAPTGRYRLEAQAAAPDTAAHARLDFVLYDAQAATIPYATPDWFAVPADTVAPGQRALVLLGSRDADARLLLEVERGGQLLRQEWLTLKAGEQRRLDLASGPATAAGPLYIHTTQVRDGRLYRHDATVQVAEKPQPLRLNIATFRDKLQPGQKESWRVTIHQANGRPAEAELLATLYDQSLDIFRQHSFTGLDFGGEYYPARFGWEGEFGDVNSATLETTNGSEENSALDYPELNTWNALAGSNRFGGRRILARGRMQLNEVVVADSAPMMAASMATKQKSAYPPPPPAPGAPSRIVNGMPENGDIPDMDELKDKVSPDLAAVPTRTDFRETAFWEPALHTDKNGDIVLEFQMPEAVTRWQLLALAHDKQLRTGQLARQLVTQKEIQITPNAPRFLRPGDTFTFPAKFSNLTDHATSGTAQLFLLDAATGQDITSQLLRGNAQQAVSAAAHQSQALGWELSLPTDFAPVAVTYRIVAQSSGGEAPVAKNQKSKPKNQPGTSYSDGEENTPARAAQSHPHHRKPAAAPRRPRHPHLRTDEAHQHQ